MSTIKCEPSSCIGLRKRGASVAVTLTCQIWALVSSGQVVTDRSFGRRPVSIDGAAKLITPDLGKPMEGNLFHSFRQFNLNSGESATFTGDPGVKNVIARVTGRQPSSINGAISCAIPNANFYFINPAGVIVGPEGSIIAEGAVVMSTADRLLFSKGRGRFDATHPSDSVLTTAPPAAFGFTSRVPANIQVRGSGLSLQGLRAARGQVLSVIAGDVEVSGGARLEARGGAVNVVSIASLGTVTLNATDPDALPQLNGFERLGRVELKGGTLDGQFGGGVRVRAQDLTLERQQIEAGDFKSEILANTSRRPSRGIDIQLSGQFDVRQGSRLNADTVGPVRGGDISVRAGQISLRDPAIGDDVIGSDVALDPVVAGTGTGVAGNITLDAKHISIRDGARLNSQTFGSGRGGNITVNAGASLLIDSGAVNEITGINAATAKDSSGAGGHIVVTAPSLKLLSGGEITSVTKGAGLAGTIHVTTGQLVIDGYGTSTQNSNGLKQSQIAGRAGTSATPTGSGSLVSIKADDLRLTNSGVISASTFGAGNGGDVEIHTGSLLAQGAQVIPFAGVFARSATDDGSPATGFGRAGSITVHARGSIVLRDGGQISVFSEQTSAGAISLSAARSIELSDRRGGVMSALIAARQTGEPVNTRISTQALQGTSGDITLNTPGRIMLYNSFITARAGGDTGATIRIDPPVVALNRSVIDGRAIKESVHVSIDPSALLIKSTDSLILSENTSLPPDLELSGALLRLPAGLFSADAELRDNCVRQFGGEASSFRVQGRGSAAHEPGGWAPSMTLQP